MEGAPRELVEHALDARAELRRAEPFHLSYEPGIGLRLVCRGTLDAGSADAMTDLLAHVVSSIAHAADCRRLRVDGGYRASALADRSEDDREIADLEELRQHRRDESGA